MFFTQNKIQDRLQYIFCFLGMTRFSKFTGGQRKRPEEPTDWQDLQPTKETASSCQENGQRQYEKRRHSPHKKHSRQSNTGGKDDNMERGFNLKKFGFSDGKEEELFTMLKKETRRENRRVKRQKNKQEEKVN